jgi:monoamine oxidase
MSTSQNDGGFTFLRRTADEDGFEMVNVAGKGARTSTPISAVPIEFDEQVGGHVLVLGAGVAGLTVAYDLLRRPGRRFSVTILEAQNHVGGRSLTLRDGNSFTEEIPLATGAKSP